jgi:hypothetical protein
VAGGAVEEDVSGAGAGFGSLGWSHQKKMLEVSRLPVGDVMLISHLVHDADDETLLFDLVRLNSFLVLQDFACQTKSAISRP